MDKKIENCTADFLQNRAGHTDRRIVTDHVVAAIGTEDCAIQAVDKCIDRMYDKGEIAYYSGSNSSMIRLTDKGLQNHKPFIIKMINYIAANWIAIVTMIVSMITFIIAITHLGSK